MEAKNPLVQWDVAPLHHGADRNREMAPASIALMQAFPCARALESGDANG